MKQLKLHDAWSVRLPDSPSSSLSLALSDINPYVFYYKFFIYEFEVIDTPLMFWVWVVTKCTTCYRSVQAQ